MLHTGQQLLPGLPICHKCDFVRKVPERRP